MPTIPLRKPAIVAATVALVAGGAIVAVAANTGQHATCGPSPYVTTNADRSQTFSVRCTVPAQAQATVTQTVTQTVTSGPSSTPTTSSPTSTSPTSQPTGGTSVLNLPRIPWSGGNAYYQQFAGTSNYKDASVFPIVAFYADGDPTKIKAASAINTVVRNNRQNDFRAYAAAGLNVIEGQNDPDTLMANSDFSSPNLVGVWLDDEVDGRYDPPSKGQAVMRQDQQAAQASWCPSYRPPSDVNDDAGTPCKFEYANYTGTVTSYYNDTQVQADETYVNMLKGAVSVDGYYYTDPSCKGVSGTGNTRHDYQVNAPDDNHCRTSAAYGNFIDNLRTRDSVKNPDGSAPTLQPLYGFVELGSPGSDGATIQPSQVKGAVMSEVIHGANGIDYFDVSFSGCAGGEAIPGVADDPSNCRAPQVAAAKQVNTYLASVAPILNTQSYAYDFGAPSVATMLKVKDGKAYIFADVALNKDAGTSTLTLPDGVNGTTATVTDQDGKVTTVPVTNHKVTLTLAHEYDYQTLVVNL